MIEDTYKEIQKKFQEEMMAMVDIAVRNEAIADIMGFKRYYPGKQVEDSHKQHYNSLPMKWYWIPNIGRYNSFELKFHEDWKWLVSATIELRKYRNTHDPKSELRRLFWLVEQTKILDLDLKNLWTCVSNYAIELLKQKQQENGTFGINR